LNSNNYTTRFNTFIDENLYRYLHLQSINMCIIDGFTDRNSPLEKLLLVIYGLSVSVFVINISMDLQTDRAHQKNYPLHHIGISIG
jgi:hypothetical protein